MDKVQQYLKPYMRTNTPSLRAGDVVRVHERIKEGDRERIQIFEGLVISCKHGKTLGGMFAVRKISHGVGVERTFPIHSPRIQKIEIVRHEKVRRAKLYYVRALVGAKAKKRRTKPIAQMFAMEDATPETVEDLPEATQETPAEETEATKEVKE